MAKISFTLEELSKIQDIAARLGRDPAFLEAVEKAIKGVSPTAPADIGQHTTEVTETPSGEKSKVERTVSFGWSVPVSDDNTVPLAAVLANAVSIHNIGVRE